MLEVKLSTVFGKPRGRNRPACYSVYVDGCLLGEITTPIVPGRQKRWFKVRRWIKGKDVVVGLFDAIEPAVAALLEANGIASALPFTITKEPETLAFLYHQTLKDRRPFFFDESSYLGDDEDGVYWTVSRNSDDGKWYTLVAVGSETIGVDFLLDYKGPFDSWRGAAETGLQVALDWLDGRMPVESKDVEAIREDIRSRSTEG